MKLTGITNHAKQRISERSILYLYEIADIINAQRILNTWFKTGDQ